MNKTIHEFDEIEHKISWFYMIMNTKFYNKEQKISYLERQWTQSIILLNENEHKILWLQIIMNTKFHGFECN